MNISKDLLLSTLAIDSYKRGYGAEVSGLSDAKNVQIRSAIIDTRLEDISYLRAFSTASRINL